MTRPFQDWLAEGESIYTTALNEYESIEKQLEALEVALAGKRSEVNQIAQVIGKQPLQTNRRLSAELVDSAATGTMIGSVTRALTGRGNGR